MKKEKLNLEDATASSDWCMACMTCFAGFLPVIYAGFVVLGGSGG